MPYTASGVPTIDECNHHTGDYIHAELEAFLQNWHVTLGRWCLMSVQIFKIACGKTFQVRTKTIAIVTDGGSNVTLAARLLEGAQSFCCVAHLINLCVRDVVDEVSRVDDIFNACSSIVGSFKHSEPWSWKLRTRQEGHQLTQCQLVQVCSPIQPKLYINNLIYCLICSQDLPMRWNSTFLMLDSVLRNKDPLIDLFADPEYKFSRLTLQDFEFASK